MLIARAARRPAASRIDEGRRDAAIAPQLALKRRLRLGQAMRVNTRENRWQATRIFDGKVNAQNLTSVSSIFDLNNVGTQFHHVRVTFYVWEL
jgi:hypothetical protein